MSIYLDEVHLMSTESDEELHQFAQEIGLKRSWFQPYSQPHYDILSRRIRALVIRKGAAVVTGVQLVRIMREAGRWTRGGVRRRGGASNHGT